MYKKTTNKKQNNNALIDVRRPKIERGEKKMKDKSIDKNIIHNNSYCLHYLLFLTSTFVYIELF